MPRGNERHVDASRFSINTQGDVPRSMFDVQHQHKTTFVGGYLVPILVEEVLPGDSMSLALTAFARLSTPIVPVMDNLTMETYFFFVPNRLVWSNWQRFMGEQASPSDTTVFLVPQVEIPVADITAENVYDYVGLTLNNTAAAVLSVNALPFRGMRLIWNEWFRDEDLQTKLTVPLGDGPDASGYGGMLPVGKRHDYFTSSRPWPQKPVNLVGSSSNVFPTVPGGAMTYPQAGAPVTGLGIAVGAAVPGGPTGDIRNSGGRLLPYALAYATNVHDFYMRADAGGLNPDVRILVNDIRTATLVQHMMEKNARGGTRYVELIWNHFKVRSPDARLQRPEYLGGGRTPITVNPVAQTSASGATGTTTVLGEQAGIGTMSAHGHGFSSSFTEHGFVLGFLCVRSDLTYQNGVERFWWRRTQYDYFWPSFEGLGEQAIAQREIFAVGSAADRGVFGYQERYAEYKYRQSRTSGYMRSTWPTPLDMWHFAQDFPSAPALNDTFIIEDAPIDRVLQVTSNHGAQFLCDMLFRNRMVRPMRMFSVPGMGARL